MTDAVLILLMIVIIGASLAIYVALRWLFEFARAVWESMAAPFEADLYEEEERDLMREGVKHFTDTEPHL